MYSFLLLPFLLLLLPALTRSSLSAACSLTFSDSAAIFNGFARSLCRSSLRCLRKTYGFSRITADAAAAASDYARGSLARPSAATASDSDSLAQLHSAPD